MKIEKLKDGVSVIVCCYNSAKLLPETIKHLAFQELTDNIKWEIIIVNNNSTDNTKFVAIKELKKYSIKNATFKVIDQATPGLSFAREKGIEQSKYKYFIFCDDDNWLAKNYLATVYRILTEKNHISVLGGFGTPVYEITEPTWFKKLNIRHAVGEQGVGFENITAKKGAVYGAGMSIRRLDYEKIKNAGFKSLLSDRKGKSLSSGGDTELCFALRLINKQIYYSENLKFKHFFTKKRLTWKYNRKIVFAGGKSYANLLIYEFLYKNRNVFNKNDWNNYLNDNIKRYFIKVFSSFKRLIHYVFVDIEGEEYILNYEFNFGMLFGLIQQRFNHNIISNFNWLLNEKC